ncbi:PREDICTED: keratin-associated protein 12-3 [Cercocebus atys]|uniref:keratin-associated protein 12-3 n=1 Tax=Cercocebus atys TaxID=9531 RepID=UPI0005F46170|nr:PREDICTED: keratin-associated protein 12-3 [Cercocebus atys]
MVEHNAGKCTRENKMLGNNHEEDNSHVFVLPRCPGPRYKDHQRSGFQTSPPSSPVPAQPHAIMCQTSCSPGCQLTCCIPSPCQASCYVPVSCQSSVCVPVSCTRIVCVAPSCQPSVCVPVSCRPIIYVTPSCQSSGCCQPPCTTVFCRPISCSAPSCC